MIKVRYPALLTYILYVLVLMDMRYEGVKCHKYGSVDSHMLMGKKLLDAGQLSDALSHFHAAVDGCPKNHMAYYRRATVFLAMRKSKSALSDLSRAIELKPDFTSALLQRGNLYLKQGRLDDATRDLKKLLKSNPSAEEMREAKSLLTKSGEIERLVNQARGSLWRRDYETAAAQLNTVVETCVWDATSREIRAECFLQMGEMEKAIGDLKAASKLKSDNTQAFYKLATIYYNLGDHEMSLMYADAVRKYETVMKTEPNVRHFSLLAKERMCHALAQGQQAGRAVSVCGEVLQADPENVSVLKDRAEAYVQEEDYEEAIKDYKTAAKHSENDPRIKEGLEKAQRLLKESQKMDYYDILGVKKTAQKDDIVKAYRRLAQKWHPDMFQDPYKKKKAEKKFVAIALAKEVLTDPAMRTAYDQGKTP